MNEQGPVPCLRFFNGDSFRTFQSRATLDSERFTFWNRGRNTGRANDQVHIARGIVSPVVIPGQHQLEPLSSFDYLISELFDLSIIDGLADGLSRGEGVGY